MPGSSDSCFAQALEPDEDHWDEIVPVQTDLGHERLEASPVRKSGNETDLVAGRVAKVVRDEEDGREEGRRLVQRQLQRGPEEHSERGKEPLNYVLWTSAWFETLQSLLSS